MHDFNDSLIPGPWDKLPPNLVYFNSLNLVYSTPHFHYFFLVSLSPVFLGGGRETALLVVTV
jgi:hypothetical protein